MLKDNLLSLKEKVVELLKFKWTRDFEFAGFIYILIVSFGLVRIPLCTLGESFCEVVDSSVTYIVFYLSYFFSIYALYILLKFVVYVFYIAYHCIANRIKSAKNAKVSKPVATRKPTQKKVVKASSKKVSVKKICTCKETSFKKKKIVGV